MTPSHALKPPQVVQCEVGCPLCSTTKTCLQQILSGCKVVLTYKGYRWRNHQVLVKLAELLEGSRVTTNPNLETVRSALAAFVKQVRCAEYPHRNLPLRIGKMLQMLADLRRQLVFSREIITTMSVHD